MRLASTVSLASRARPLALAVLLCCLAGRTNAAPVFTGTGAGAWVSGLNQFAQQQGPTPATISGSTTVEYTKAPVWTNAPPYNTDVQPASLTATYSAYAAAAPAALGTPLLELRGSTSSPNPGDTVGVRRPDPSVEMNAYWGGVIAKVEGPTGAALPDSIRLDFSVAYTPPSSIQQEDWGFNQWMHAAQAISVNYSGNLKLPDLMGNTPLPDQGPVTLGADGLLHTSFSLTLPLSKAGDSQAFSIGISSELDGMIEMQAVHNSSVTMLTLDSITLPDGTNLEDDGYTVAFDSGNPLPPPPVPEPTTWLAWGLLAAGSTCRFRRLRNGPRGPSAVRRQIAAGLVTISEQIGPLARPPASQA